jgi:hypothetical protein
MVVLGLLVAAAGWLGRGARREAAGAGGRQSPSCSVREGDEDLGGGAREGSGWSGGEQGIGRWTFSQNNQTVQMFPMTTTKVR